MSIHSNEPNDPYELSDHSVTITQDDISFDESSDSEDEDAMRAQFWKPYVSFNVYQEKTVRSAI